MTLQLPQKALSVRQPWAWAIVTGYKPIENRSWRRPNPALGFRGPVCIHAAGGMTRDEYDYAARFMAALGVTCPAPHCLARGGIIGTAIIDDVVRSHPSPWFFGPVGLVLAGVALVPFIRSAGNLGFFSWLQSSGDEQPLPPAKWMLPQAEAGPTIPAQGQLEMFV